MKLSSQNDLTHWLMLNRIPKLALNQALRLIASFKDIYDIFNRERAAFNAFNLEEATLYSLKNPEWSLIENDIKWAEKSKQHHIITLNDPRYPSLLKQIHCPPLVLYCKGDITILNEPQLAVVGSRKPTPMGVETAFDFSYQIAELNLIVTSGLALGIDTAAHEGAIKALNKTIAVMGTGFSTLYPKENKRLAGEIANRGLLVSEFPFETPPLKYNFPRRNRLISGLSLGTLVVEASLRSGSLTTAKFANDQGRDVFAVPGSIYNANAKGCHFLISQGAKLVEKVEDIVGELTYLLPKTITYKPKKRESKQIMLDDHQAKLLECVGFEPTSVDFLVTRSGLPIHLITTTLVDLESKGFVVNTLGGYTRVRS